MEVRAQTRIAHIKGTAGAWQLEDVDGHQHCAEDGTCFDFVVIALPAPQAAEILAELNGDDRVVRQWQERSRLIQPLSQWVCLLETATDPVDSWDIFQPDSSAVLQVIRNHTKPQRTDLPATWVVAMRYDWTEAHLEMTPDEVLPHIHQALQSVLPESAQLDITWQQAHRWRFSRVAAEATMNDVPADVPEVDVLATNGLAVAGDWLTDGTVQGAWQSAVRAVSQLS